MPNIYTTSYPGNYFREVSQRYLEKFIRDYQEDMSQYQRLWKQYQDYTNLNKYTWKFKETKRRTKLGNELD